MTPADAYDVPEQPVRGWRPPRYEMDEDGKVIGATPGEPNNWGRWGAADQRGTLNLMTPRSVREAAGLVRTGQSFALGLPIGPPTTGAVPTPQVLRTSIAGDSVLDPPSGHPPYSDEVIVLGTQSYTQLDGLAHVASPEGTMYNGYWSGLVTTAHGAKRLGIHHMRGGVIGRGVLLDLARHLDVPVVPAGVEIGPDLLDETLAAQGVTLSPGDVLLIRTGLLGSWPGTRGTMGTSPQPGLSNSAAPWLAARDIMLVGADNSAVEALDATAGSWDIPLHLSALHDLGLPLAELLWLDDLATACATDGIWDCMFIAQPLPIVGAAGSPLNPMALR
jgi:kynurenine formamidase